MKHFLLSIVIAFLFITDINASHLMGAEISYKHIANNEYEVTLIVYRDCSGIDVGATQNVIFESATCGQNFVVAMPLVDTIEVSQVCPGQTTTCNGGTLPGSEQWIYVDTVTMTTCSDWLIHWNSGTRNPAITNLVNPNTQNLFILTTLNNIAGTNNNSPQFSAIPTPYLCANQLSIFSHGAYDADGDSLYYSLAQPLTTPGPPGTPIAFTAGHTINDPILTISGMNLNPLTGDMCFTPSQAQTCVVSVLISEYRNNTLIGTQIRELQVVVDNSCANSAPSIGLATPTCGNIGGLTITSAGPSVTQIDSNSITMCPDDNVCFEVYFNDINGDNINVSTNIATSIPSATFTITGNGTPNPVGTFCWIPTSLSAGINPFTIAIQDDACPLSASRDYTYDVTVFDQPNAGQDQTICASQEAQFQATGGGGYIWSVITGDPISVATNFSCTSCSDPIASPSTTTTYLLTSSLAASCLTTDTITVFVVPDFTYDAIGDTALCDYLDVQLEVNITSGPVGTYLYNWDNASTLNNSAIQNPIASPTETTWYTAEVTSPNGCVKKTDTVQIKVTPPPTVQIIPGDTTICIGASLNFDVSLSAINDDFNSGFNPSIWSNVSGATVTSPCVTFDGTALNFDAALRELNTNSINITNCTTVDFCLWIANDASSGSCENADLGEDVVLNYNTGSGWITLQTYTSSDWDTGGPYANTWQCFSVTIPAIAQTGATQFQWTQIGGYGATIDNWALDNISISCGGNTAYGYSWSPGTDLSATNISNPTLSNATITTNYVVTITDTASGCSIDRNQTITVVPNYTLTTTQSDTNICLGENVSFSVSTNPSGSYNYSWSPSGVMDNPAIANPVGTFITPGTNTIIATVSSSGGCQKMDTLIVNASYGFTPNITMTPDSITICTGDNTQLNIDLVGGIPSSCGLSQTNACSGALSQTIVGSGTTNLGAPSPYYGFYEDNRVQMIYEASELNALGFTGGKITEVTFDVLIKASTQPYENFTIKMGCTSTSDFTGATQFESGLFQVFNTASSTTIAGLNTHILDNAYEWDGVSNLIVEICFDNTAWTSTDVVAQTATTSPLTLAKWADNQVGCTLNTPSAYSERPNIQLTQCSTTSDPNIYSYAWTPTLGLSDPTIQNPIANPTTTTTYSVTVTDTLGGCFNSGTVTVTIDLCTYINEVGEALDINISPNPNNGQFSITKPDGLSETVHVKLLSADGKLIIQKTILENENAVNIDITNYSKGIYFLYLSVGEQYFTRKIVRN
jgi:hypothetical protein